METIHDPTDAIEPAVIEPAWEKVTLERKRITLQPTEGISTKKGSNAVTGTSSVMYMHPKYLGSVEKERDKTVLFSQRNLPTKVGQLVTESKEIELK